MKNVIDMYHDYRDKIGNRRELYRVVTQRYNIKSALYPGSHIDIAPSFFIPNVIYVDNFKGAIIFFKDIDIIKSYINENKEYEECVSLCFLGQDYMIHMDIEPVDLIISQYAGFVSEACKNYLKVGGIVLCNDSHGDATLCRFDDDFEFIGVINDNNIIENNLNQYFILPKGRSVDINYVHEKMKGLKYKLMCENYIFRKVR